MKKIIAAIIICSAHLCVGYDSVPPGQLFPFSAAVIAENPDTVLSSPVYAPHINGAAFSAMYARPYSIDGLTSEGFTFGAGNNSLGLRLNAERFGIPEYHEDKASCGAGIAGEKISLGAEYSATRYVYDAEWRSSFTLGDGSVHALVSPLSFFVLGVRQDNLYSLKQKERQDILWPGTALGIGGRPMKGVFVSWNYFRSAHGAINSYTMMVNLLPRLSVSAGYAREISSFALSSSIAVKNIIASYGLNYHSYLGVTHKAGFTCSLASPTFESIALPEKRIDPEQDESVMVDLTQCTLDELRAISSLSEIHAERLIRYREIMGPLSERALYQMGLSHKEIDAIEAHSTGLVYESDDKNGKDGEKKKFTEQKRKPFVSKTQIRKSLFIRLVESGIPASRALRIGDLAMQHPMSTIIEKIDSIDGLTLEDKKKAKAVCSAR